METSLFLKRPVWLRAADPAPGLRRYHWPYGPVGRPGLRLSRFCVETFAIEHGIDGQYEEDGTRAGFSRRC